MANHKALDQVNEFTYRPLSLNKQDDVDKKWDRLRRLMRTIQRSFINKVKKKYTDINFTKP